MKAVISSSVVLFIISSWQTTSSQHAPNSAWATDSFLQDGNLPTHQQAARSPAIGSSQGINQLPNGQVFTGMGWVDEEGSVSHLTTVSNIHSPEECMDACASNRKSNRQGCIAFTFVETIQRCDLKSQTNAHSLKRQDSHSVMSAKCTSGCGRTGRTNLPATGGKCFYECEDTGVCHVDFEANGAYSGGTRGSCTSEEFGWSGDCSGTPRFCRDCKHKCRGSWGTNFRELVGSEIAGSGQNIPPAPPPRTTVRPEITDNDDFLVNSGDYDDYYSGAEEPEEYEYNYDYGSETKVSPPPPPPPRTTARPTAPRTAPLPHKCQRIRIRKDAHKLTQGEKTQLRYAMNKVREDRNFQEIASYHGAPYGEKCTHDRSGRPMTHMGCCKHPFDDADYKPKSEGAYENFWAWHRLYLVQMELAMEPYLKGTDLGLPYWDWTENEDLPDVWADIYPEIKSFWSDDYKSEMTDSRNPNLCHNPSSGNQNDLSKISRIRPEFGTFSAKKQKKAIDDANAQSVFLEFSKRADLAHGTIHVALNCSMPSTATTAYDPTFWMHHANIDKVLADRQANTKFGQVPHFNNDRRRILEPFGNSRVNPYELTKITNNETLDHYNNLCYCYDSLENCAKTSNNDPFFVEKAVFQILQREVSKQIAKQVERKQCIDVPRQVCHEVCGEFDSGCEFKCDTVFEPKCEIVFETVYEEKFDIAYDTKYTEISEKISKLSVSVGFIVPKGFGGVGIPFKACYKEKREDLVQVQKSFGSSKCEESKLYLFGGSKDVISDTPVNSENYDISTSFLFTREITSLTQDYDIFRVESLQLLGYENSLPIDAPIFVVVQITNGDKDYTFAQLQEGVQKQGYGNLLDDYNGVKDFGYSFGQDLSTLLNK